MELVLADDFSGAAEIAGLAFRCGRSVSLLTGIAELSEPPETEVVVVDSDSRLLSPKAATERVAEICRRLQPWKLTRVYKKIDSVLRGPVLPEIEAVLDSPAFQFSDAIAASANPDRGRVIRGGRYYIDDVPLHETGFAEDPAFPAEDSSLRELVGESSRVRFPNVESMDDLQNLAGDIGEKTLPVGGADFYRAIHEIDSHVAVPAILLTRRLWVCGSRSNRPCRERLFAEHNIQVFSCDATRPPESRAQSVLERLDVERSVALTLPEEMHPDPGSLEEAICQVAAALIQELRPDAVLIEGGSTARHLVDRLGWNRFTVQGELAAGVVGIRFNGKADAPLIIVKPGSYLWPDGVFA